MSWPALLCLDFGSTFTKAVLVDLDPLGPGLDRVLGLERCDGVRWDALLQTTGRLSARSLHDALPRRNGLGVLTWPPGPSRSWRRSRIPRSSRK